MSTQHPRLPASRNQALELLRIVSAFGIIAYHAGVDFRELAYAGLVVFLVMSPMFDAGRWHKHRPISAIANTLLKPWLFWSLCYGTANLALHRPILAGGSPILGMLYGTSPHLWFLPFLFGVLAIMNLAKPHIRRAPLFWASLASCLALILTASLWRPASLLLPAPLPQWIHSAAPALAGISLGLAAHIRRGPALALGGLALALGALVMAAIPGVSISYSIGIALVALVARFGAKAIPAGWSLQPVSDCMLGVYLIHVFVLKAVEMLTGSANYATVSLTFVTATALVWGARRYLPRSKAVLG